ncbi:MAG: acyl-CoA synthetase, partial [Actinobacteria bacterium HGW-Actinobacteria-9]
MLEGFFEPGSITVVGVAREEGKVGHFVFDNLRDGGFPGPVYPVNPNAEEIHGERCYASISDLPQAPDLAVIVVPARFVPDVIDDCAVKGIGSAIVISAGFKESGPEGGALEREVLVRARAGGVRVLGPNCLGLIASRTHLNASFAAGMPPAGGIAFMSQSGALGTAVLDWAAGGGIGLSHFVSLGNRADLSEIDLMRAWAANPDTRVIVGYLESVADGPAFLRDAAETTAVKPVIVVKSGRSDAGARAVSSHTGSLAGSDAAYDAAFRATGVIRAHNVQQLFDYAVGFSLQPLPSGALAILTNAGGPAVMATDACEEAGVALASLENTTVDNLREALPPAAALYNPVDILGDAGPDRYALALDALYADPNVGAVLCLLTPQAMTDAAGTARVIVERAADAR